METCMWEQQNEYSQAHVEYLGDKVFWESLKHKNDLLLHFQDILEKKIQFLTVLFQCKTSYLNVDYWLLCCEKESYGFRFI